jgi:hypothetical protein
MFVDDALQAAKMSLVMIAVAAVMLTVVVALV